MCTLALLGCSGPIPLVFILYLFIFLIYCYFQFLIITITMGTWAVFFIQDLFFLLHFYFASLQIYLVKFRWCHQHFLCPRPREEWWARKFYRVLEQKMIKIWKLNTWFNFEQPDTLEHQPDIYVYQSNWPIFICFGWKEESLFLFVVLLDIYRESETQSLQSHVYFKIFPVL